MGGKHQGKKKTPRYIYWIAFFLPQFICQKPFPKTHLRGSRTGEKKKRTEWSVAPVDAQYFKQIHAPISASSLASVMLLEIIFMDCELSLEICFRCGCKEFSSWKVISAWRWRYNLCLGSGCFSMTDTHLFTERLYKYKVMLLLLQCGFCSLMCRYIMM